eukprot:CAMPEP_0176350334 /NCGR_PEP_ID=MMETSP0126-20121128/9395_1 /TAXON_ID=141414 ORGANISM="Strombidinopsis acuminatum, Strain SPMC142" /NCGR_SAMPLE_ID=MMETSP0126 /ASSEMBLY_ACC=CAM_ASM_000229 /LENGTH=35 /DNA_ID= /DNA_START= /DNA_END= /DNA_ORIENTATION=
METTQDKNKDVEQNQTESDQQEDNKEIVKDEETKK